MGDDVNHSNNILVASNNGIWEVPSHWVDWSYHDTTTDAVTYSNHTITNNPEVVTINYRGRHAPSEGTRVDDGLEALVDAIHKCELSFEQAKKMFDTLYDLLQARPAIVLSEEADFEISPGALEILLQEAIGGE